MNLNGCADVGPIVKFVGFVDAKYYASKGNGRPEITGPQPRPAGENRQRMDAIFKITGPINANPVRHPKIPVCTIGVGDFIQHAEIANARGIAHARGGDKTINELPVIVGV